MTPTINSHRHQHSNARSHLHHQPLSAKHRTDGDGPGWVEGITRLTEDHEATALVSADPFQGNNPNSNSTGATPHANEDQSQDMISTPPQKVSNAPPISSDTLISTLSPSDGFEARIEHALHAIEHEVSQTGELVAEIGAPDGYGPTELTETQLDGVLEKLRRKAEDLGAEMTEIRRRKVPSPHGDNHMHTADVIVRRRPGFKDSTPLELRVAVIGNVDSGKSTMVGVLTRSILDDGRGLARSKVFKHDHELSTGRTSAISQHTLCLDAAGRVLNDALFKTTTTADYVARSAKVLTLVDLAGHEKYLKTTCHGLTGHFPDYACLIVGANAGIVGSSKEHLGIALALRVPLFFVITKVDLAPAHVTQHTLTTLQTILKKPGVKKRPFIVRSKDDVITCARNMHSDSLAPIFLTSSVTGCGLDLVRLFYNLLPQRVDWAQRSTGPAEFIIDETFSVPGVGTVVAGTVKRGVITPSTNFLLGPDIGDGSFNSCQVKSIHYKRLPVGKAVAGQTAALALKKIKRSQVRKGMVLLSPSLSPKSSWEFDADVAILTHSTTIQPRYQAVIHCEIIRQSARVISMDKSRLRSGDRSTVRFRFISHPEYVVPGTRFVFREGRTKGIGVVCATEAEGLKPMNGTGESGAAIE